MINVIANLFNNVHPSKAKLISFLDCNYFLIASTVSVYSLGQSLLEALPDGSTSSVCNALYGLVSSWFEIPFQGMGAETDPGIR